MWPRHMQSTQLLLDELSNSKVRVQGKEAALDRDVIRSVYGQGYNDEDEDDEEAEASGAER